MCSKDVYRHSWVGVRLLKLRNECLGHNTYTQTRSTQTPANTQGAKSKDFSLVGSQLVVHVSKSRRLSENTVMILHPSAKRKNIYSRFKDSLTSSIGFMYGFMRCGVFEIKWLRRRAACSLFWPRPLNSRSVRSYMGLKQVDKKQNTKMKDKRH